MTAVLRVALFEDLLNRQVCVIVLKKARRDDLEMNPQHRPTQPSV